MVKTLIKAVMAYIVFMDLLLFTFNAFPPIDDPFDIILAPFQMLNQPLYAVLSLGVFLVIYLWAFKGGD